MLLVGDTPSSAFFLFRSVKVPSILAITSDFDLEYAIFYVMVHAINGKLPLVYLALEHTVLTQTTHRALGKHNHKYWSCHGNLLHALAITLCIILTQQCYTAGLAVTNEAAICFTGDYIHTTIITYTYVCTYVCIQCTQQHSPDTRTVADTASTTGSGAWHRTP